MWHRVCGRGLSTGIWQMVYGTLYRDNPGIPFQCNHHYYVLQYSINRCIWQNSLYPWGSRTKWRLLLTHIWHALWNLYFHYSVVTLARFILSFRFTWQHLFHYSCLIFRCPELDLYRTLFPCIVTCLMYIYIFFPGTCGYLPDTLVIGVSSIRCF